MKKLFLIPFALIAMCLVLTSCQKEEIIEVKQETPEKNPNIQALPDVSTRTLFIARLRGNQPVCISWRGTCDWLEGGCDIVWNDDINSGLDFIENMEDADVLMDIETYEDSSVIGFRFIGLSSAFMQESSANGDDGSRFEVSETIEINSEAAEALGYQSITIQKGDYQFVTDEATGQEVVLINSTLQ